MKTNKKIKKIIYNTLLAVATLLVIIIGAISNSNNSYARTSKTNYSSSVVKKALMNMVKTCINQSQILGQDAAIQAGNFTTLDNVTYFQNSKKFYLPTSLTNVKDDQVNCYELLFGKRTNKTSNMFEGIFNLAKKSYEVKGSTLENKIELLQNLGFVERTDLRWTEQSDKCVGFDYAVWEDDGRYEGNYLYTDNIVSTNRICLSDDEKLFVSETSDGQKIVNEDWVRPLLDYYDAMESPQISEDGKAVTINLLNCHFDEPTEVSYTYNGNWNNFSNEVTNAITSYCPELYKYNYKIMLIRDSEKISAGTDASGAQIFTVSQSSGPAVHYGDVTAYKMAEYLSGSSTITFSKSEQIQLLVEEIKETYFSGENINTYWICGVNDWNMYGDFLQIKVGADAGIGQNCGIKKNPYNKDEMISGFYGAGYGAYASNDALFYDSTEKKYNLEDAVAQINRLVDSMTDEQKESLGTSADNIEQFNSPETYEVTHETAKCYDGSGAMGWILCPIISATSNIGNYMWNRIETYHMKMPAAEIFASGGAVEKVWGTVQEIANIAFIIFFLIVIFSQLTGYGIDNYGIKKILPRLVVVAILANMSFILCKIAIDLSNIIGVSANKLLSNAASSVGTTAVGASSGGVFAIGLVETLLAGGGAALFSIFATGGIGQGLVELGLLVFAIVITVVGAMLFLYAVLVIREATIILCIVLAPLAIVLYLLPNTEKLAKKWFDIFKAVLVVYPICGALVGAGKLAGVVLSSIDADNMKVAAMVVQVLPFLLIPTLLKGTLSGLGNIGAKISGFTNGLSKRVSNGVKGTVKNDPRYKDMVDYQKGNMLANRARRTMNRLDRKGKPLTARQLNKYSKAKDIVADRDAKAFEDRLTGNRQYFNAMEAERKESIINKTGDTRLWGNKQYAEAQHTKGENKRLEAMEEARAGVVKLDKKVARINAESKHNLDEAKNNPEYTPRISEDYAKSLEAQRFHTSQQKMYGEELRNLSRSDSVARLRKYLQNTDGKSIDVDMATALMDDVISKGGYEDAMNIVANDGKRGQTDDKVLSTISQKMATITAEPAMKLYGKYYSKTTEAGGTAIDFGDWMRGIDPVNCFATAMQDPSALVGADKDAFKFYNKYATQLSSEAIMNGVLSARDSETRVAGEALARTKFGTNPGGMFDTTAAISAINSITANQWASMQSSTLEAILGTANIANPTAISNPVLKNALTEAFNKVENSSGTTKAHLNTGVKDFFEKFQGTKFS